MAVKLKRLYGLSLDAYLQLKIKQNNACAICGKLQSTLKIPLSIDHDHKTKKVRGLLCPTCNMRIGIIENVEWMQKGNNYLCMTK